MSPSHPQNGWSGYHHSAILPVIVESEQENVITLMPEFIRPQDGVDIQDSETAAAKRWFESHHSLFPKGSLTLLGDDLYSRQPMRQECLDHELNFIFVCLPSSHATLYEWLEYLEANDEVYVLQERFWNGRHFEIRQYRYVNRIPLRDSQPALAVNWCEVRLFENLIVEFMLDDATPVNTGNTS